MVGYNVFFFYGYLIKMPMNCTLYNMSSVLTYQYIFPTWIITLLVDISDITKLRKIVHVLADRIEMLSNRGVGEDS